MTFRSGSQNIPAVLLLLIIALPFLDTAILNSASGQDDSIAIFDGKSLEGWEGDHELWRVDNGVLVGETTSSRGTRMWCRLSFPSATQIPFEVKPTLIAPFPPRGEPRMYRW